MNYHQNSIRKQILEKYLIILIILKTKLYIMMNQYNKIQNYLIYLQNDIFNHIYINIL